MTRPKREQDRQGLDALTGQLANLRAVEGDETQAALQLVRKRLRLNPEKLALMMLRVLNSEEIVAKGEEAVLRGVCHETLAANKDREEASDSHQWPPLTVALAFHAKGVQRNSI